MRKSELPRIRVGFVRSRSNSEIKRMFPLSPLSPLFMAICQRLVPFASCLLVMLVISGGIVVAEPAVVPQAANPLAELVTMTYQPKAGAKGEIRLVGSTTLQQAAAQWSQGFVALHPGVECSIESMGSGGGLKSLLAGQADVALMSRPVSAAEKATWETQSQQRLIVVVAAFDRLVWIVNGSNPVKELPWSPETGILRPAAAEVAAKNESLADTHWDRLNGSADWKDVPIHVHGRGLGSGTRWHMDRLLTGATNCELKVSEHDTEAGLAEAVAADRGSLGLVGDEHANWPGVKKLPLLISDLAAPLADAVVGSDRTPDCRPLFLAVSVPKDGAMPAALQEFLAYVLSYSGQLDVAKDSLLPLTRSEIYSQKELLGWPVER